MRDPIPTTSLSIHDAREVIGMLAAFFENAAVHGGVTFDGPFSADAAAGLRDVQDVLRSCEALDGIFEEIASAVAGAPVPLPRADCEIIPFPRMIEIAHPFGPPPCDGGAA